MFDLSHTKPQVFLAFWAPFSVLLAMLAAHTLSVVPGMNWLMPWLSVSVVFYWALKAPATLRVGEVFLLGLVEDALTGLPLGIHSAAFVLVHFFVKWHYVKLQHAPFVKVWVFFAGALALAIGLLLGVLVLAGLPFSFWALAIWLTTLLAFPGVFCLVFFSHKKMVV